MKLTFQGCFFHAVFQGYKYIKPFEIGAICRLYEGDFLEKG
nr:MAG TPA: hypothetical protein [Caudoviricetes sp.]